MTKCIKCRDNGSGMCLLEDEEDEVFVVSDRASNELLTHEPTKYKIYNHE